jgi:dTDP-4-dehydrorhamnose reductase
VTWLITGGGGMVARDLADALAARDERFVALPKSDFDICDARVVDKVVREVRPSVIVNCAAYTKVDAAEEHERVANAVNGSAVEFLADGANAVDALLVQLSTDFVFDGAAGEPYEVNAPTAPLSAYGRSKLLGELAATHARRHIILRTSWLFGKHGPNFVEAIRNQIRKGTNPLRVVSDQRGRPTYTPHLAEAIVRVVASGATGVVHYADAPECTWFDFAREIVAQLGVGVDVRPVTTDEFPRPARRPAYSVLSTERYERVTGVAPAAWQEGLREYLPTSDTRHSPPIP